MDWVWQSEELLHGWMLPAGSALVALGMTTLVAVAYARWRAGRARRAHRAGTQLDLRDESPRATAPREPALDLERLDRCLSELESQVESLRFRLESASPGQGGPRTVMARAAETGRVTTLDRRTGQSAEARALKAFVAADR